MEDDVARALARRGHGRASDLFSQPPPPYQTRDTRNPTLLFSWWATVFSAAIIITRLCGRKTRSNRLFREDWIMMVSLIPLFIRMAFIHVVLLYGTNNVQLAGHHLSQEEIYHRMIGSRLVLGARIFYAAYIWTCKLTISEFLKRITIRIWRRSYEWTLQGIRIFLGITFCLVIIGTLSECQPFDHYWQVVPDPGVHCRAGYGNLITMATCDTITDILLIAFPIPIIVRSGQTWRRKLQLSSLFSLSFIPVAITLSRVVLVIDHYGQQQYRTVWASCEILAATAVANAVIIGSFLRDKGTKKNKYRSPSVSDSITRSNQRRPTVTALQNTGSEEDLFRFLGIRVPDHLQEETETGPRLAPTALSATEMQDQSRRKTSVPTPKIHEPSGSHSSDSDDSLRKPPIPAPTIVPQPPSSSRGMSFFDVGGLLEDGSVSPGSRSHTSAQLSPNHGGAATHDFASHTPGQSRRGSHAFLQDVGGLFHHNANSPSHHHTHGHHAQHRHADSHARHSTHLVAPTGVLGPMLERHETQQSLQDAGGLLSTPPDAANARRAYSDVHELLPSASSSRARHGLGADDDEDEGDGLPDLIDIGALLSESRNPEPSAAALQRAMARMRSPGPHDTQARDAAASSSSMPPSGSGWETMNIMDPGGLLGQ